MCVLAPVGQAFAAEAPQEAPCLGELQAISTDTGVPESVLDTLSQLMSGKEGNPDSAQIAWPWVISLDGQRQWFATRAEALSALKTAWSDNSTSLKAGCMMIDVARHRAAFETLDDFLSADQNMLYAARLLAEIHKESDSWIEAAGTFYSRVVAQKRSFQARFATAWHPEDHPTFRTSTSLASTWSLAGERPVGSAIAHSAPTALDTPLQPAPGSLVPLARVSSTQGMIMPEGGSQ